MTNRDYVSAYIFLLPLAGVVIALDQSTKWLVRTNLSIGESWMYLHWLEPYARVVHWKNTGAAFGILQGFGGMFSVLAIVVAVFILYYFPRVAREDWPLRFAMGLQLGGAVGNLTDRLTVGWVTDFISVGSFPVFNVADSSIFIGVVVLMLRVWSTDRGKQTESASKTSGELSGMSVERENMTTAPSSHFEDISGEFGFPTISEESDKD